jgi:hypothetical protein
MMRTILLSLLLVATSQAAVLRGMVVEAQTGKALARTLVVVQPVAGGSGATQSIRTNTNGIFQFPPMPAGAYLVSASRRAFAPVQYGQKGWKGSGVPITLQEENETRLRITLPRYGAITGRIVDENDVGLPEHDVIAYRNTRPPVLVAKATTDDRGIYRIFGLEPGAYVVRTATKLYDESSGYVPTFYKDGTTVDNARPVEVVLDQDVPDIVVRPSPGRLFNVAGLVSNVTFRNNLQVMVTLLSDMGSETVTADSSGRYRFSPVAPGKYEIYSQAFFGRNEGTMAAFQAFEIMDRDQNIYFSLKPQPDVQFVFEDTKGAPLDSSSVQILARQKQLSGDSPTQFLRPGNNRQTFAPGRWEFSLSPNYAFYVAAFNAPNRQPRPGDRADGWNEVLLEQASPTIKFVLSNNPGAIHGVVAGAPGAPVFLEAYDPERKRRLGELRTTRTDVRGQFQFTGLAPGTYRLLSTFDFQLPEPFAMDAAAPLSLKVEEGSDLPAQLTLYVRP